MYCQPDFEYRLLLRYIFVFGGQCHGCTLSVDDVVAAAAAGLLLTTAKSKATIVLVSRVNGGILAQNKFYTQIGTG